MLQDRRQVMRTTAARLREFIKILIRKSVHGVPVQASAQGDPSELFLFLLSWFTESLNWMEQTSQSMTRIAEELRDKLANFLPLCCERTRCRNGHRSIKPNREFLTLTISTHFRSLTDCLTNKFSTEEYVDDGICGTCNCVGVFKKQLLSELPTDLFALNLVYNRVNNVNN